MPTHIDIEEPVVPPIVHRQWIDPMMAAVLEQISKPSASQRAVYRLLGTAAIDDVAAHGLSHNRGELRASIVRVTQSGRDTLVLGWPDLGSLAEMMVLTLYGHIYDHGLDEHRSQVRSLVTELETHR